MKKKFIQTMRALALGCLALFLIAGFGYAWLLRGTSVVSVYKTYRYLVSAEEHLQASAETAYLQGGAGYVLERDRFYAVYACYPSEEQAMSAQKNLKDRQIETEIYVEQIGKLYLKTEREKAQEEKIVGVLKTLDDCVRFLGVLSNKAETGEYTQSELKDSLFATRVVLERIAKEATGKFKILSETSNEAVLAIERIGADIVLAKDIRYEQIRISDGMIRFCRQFSL